MSARRDGSSGQTAVLLGMGGLGCPASLALVEEALAAGPAGLTLVLVDPDTVDRSNLSRQILFYERDIGRLKVEVAAERLRALTGAATIAIETRAERFDAPGAARLLERATVLIDGTDSAETRFLANDLACRAGVPLVHGAVLGWQGQVLTVLPEGPCLRCLFEGPPGGLGPTCAEAGVASPLCGVIGAAMASAAVAVLRGGARGGVLLRWDALAGPQRPLPLRRDSNCAGCGPEARAC